MGNPISKKIFLILERFCMAVQRQPLYQYIYYEDDGGLTELDNFAMYIIMLSRRR